MAFTVWVKKHKLLTCAIVLFLIYVIVLKIVSAHRLNYLGDEPDDLTNILQDLKIAPNFFSHALSPDQSRLSIVLTVPALLAGANGALFWSRMISLVPYIGFLLIVYKLLRLHLSQLQSYFGMVLVGTSCYLSSFAVFNMTSSSNFFMFFATLSLYYYLRHFDRAKKATTTQAALLGISLGLATSAKLFGVVLILAILLYDAAFRLRQKQALDRRDIATYAKGTIGNLNIAFTILWLVINVWPTFPVVKLISMLLLSAGYAYYLWQELHAEDEHESPGFINRWLTIVHTAAVITIITSPIYFNVRNVFGVFGWFKEWDLAGLIVHSSHWDFFTTVGIKLGLIPGVSILVCLCILAYQKKLRSMLRDYALLWLVFSTFTLVFIKLNFFVAWYPLFIFWFLYIPFCYLMPPKLDRTKLLPVVLATLIFLLPVYESVRYFRLFPYAHTDGAQLGMRYVGINRPGFITFESLSDVANYIEAHPSPGSMNCQLVYAKRFNGYAINSFNQLLAQKNVPGQRCRDYDINNLELNTAITSFYSSSAQVASVAQHYHRQQVFYINTIPVATMWQHN